MTSPDKMAESIGKRMHSHGLCYFSQLVMDPPLDDQSTANRLFNNSVNPAFYVLVVLNATFLKSNVPMKVSRGS